MSNVLGHNKGGDGFIVPRGTTEVGRRRMRPPPMPASKPRALREGQAQTWHRYRLKNADGALLHMGVRPYDTDLLFVTEAGAAWIGNEAQLTRLREKFPETRNLTAVLVPRKSGSEILHSRRL